MRERITPEEARALLRNPDAYVYVEWSNTPALRVLGVRKKGHLWQVRTLGKGVWEWLQNGQLSSQ